MLLGTYKKETGAPNIACLSGFELFSLGAPEETR